MSKVRLCSKYKKIENQSMYFYIECRQKIEAQKIQNDYKSVKSIEKSELHITEKVTSIDKIDFTRDKMADIIWIINLLKERM